MTGEVGVEVGKGRRVGVVEYFRDIEALEVGLRWRWSVWFLELGSGGRIRMKTFFIDVGII